MIKPHWSAPHFVNALCTPLQENLPDILPPKIEWITQTHSTRCVTVEETAEREADASITRLTHCALVIKTADCLPILLSSSSQPEIAAIHAGWRGLAGGVVESTLTQLKSAPQDLSVWIGPAICGKCFEVGGEVCDVFLSRYPFAEEAIFPHHGDPSSLTGLGMTRGVEKWHIDLKKIATLLFNQLSITQVFQTPLCTFEEKSLFSYRRDKQTGRIGTFIWLTEP